MTARRYWLSVLLLSVLSAAAGLNYVHGHLGINTNTADMISRQLDWRQRDIEFNRLFPQFRNTVLVVIDAQTPDLASASAAALERALGQNRKLFTGVRRPGHSSFFERNALLYLDPDELGRLADDLSAGQPLLQRLGSDPSLYAVARLLKDALEAREDFKSDALDRFAAALADAVEALLAGRFHQLSWQRLLGADPQGDGPSRQVLIVTPKPDFSSLFPVSSAIAAIRAEAVRLSLDTDHGVRLRITGGLAMSDEELHSVTRGAGRAAILALAGVSLVLVLGLGSLRLVGACLLTLLIGLIWTAAFAAAAVGQLNMISIAFAVLYIGLGVDYAVHYGLRYRELRNMLVDHDQALAHAATDAGAALALCALTTGIGFFAFVPTEFAGVSELGLIAGVGMFISLAATLTLMPALLTALNHSMQGLGGVTVPGGAVLGRWLYRHQRGILLLFVVSGLLASLSLLQLRFDSDPLNLRDGDGEAVSTYRELVADNDNWSLDVLLPGAKALALLRRDLEILPGVSDTRALVDFVPGDQDRKLDMIDDLALLLGPGTATPAIPTGLRKSAAALVDLGTALAAAADKSPGLVSLGAALQQLQPLLGRVLGAGDKPDPKDQAALQRLDQSVLGALPEQLRRLRLALNADFIDLQSLPESLRRDWQTADGRLRLQINAAVNLNRAENLERFVDQVRAVAPAAVGTPIIHLQAGRVVVQAFQQAFALALACIAVLLWLILRNGREVLLVLIPLLLAGLFSVAAMVMFGMHFNFANVIALPLLLGIGVDSGIHILSRARLGEPPQRLTASMTARAVLVSALSTTLSFGNLAFSDHPGTASMGMLLAIGMAATLVCTLLLLPVLLWHFDPASKPRTAS